MKTQLRIFLLFSLLAPLFSSCLYNVIDGNGELVEETRTIPVFNEISSSGSFHVYYQYADTPEVTISCESNIMVYIETYVYKDELIISTPFDINLRPHETIEVYVKGPKLEKMHLSGSGLISTDTISSKSLELSVSGSGDIETWFTGENLTSKISGSGNMLIFAECTSLETFVSGSGKINIKGMADYAKHTISGSGKMQSYDFEVKEADITISGSGDLFVNVTEYLDATISGSGNIYYIGDCSVNSNNYGSGRIINNN